MNRNAAILTILSLTSAAMCRAQHLERSGVSILPMQTTAVPKISWHSKGFKIQLKGSAGRSINGWIRMFRASGAGEPEGTAKKHLMDKRVPESDNCIQFTGFHQFPAHITADNVLVVDGDLDDTYLALTRPTKSDQRWVLVFEDNRSPDSRGIWIAQTFLPHYFSSGIEVDIDAAGVKPLPPPSAPTYVPASSSGSGYNNNPFFRLAGYAPPESLEGPCLEGRGDIQVKRERVLLAARSYACAAGPPREAVRE